MTLRYHKLHSRPSSLYEVWADSRGKPRCLGTVWYSCRMWFNSRTGKLYATRRAAARGLVK